MMTAMLPWLLALAAVAVATVAGWTLTACAWLAINHARLAGLKHRARCANRAILLAQVRLVPLAAVVILVTAQIVAFARFEAGGTETAGPLLIVLALAGLFFLGDALVAVTRTWRQTRDIVGRWRIDAAPLALPAWTRRAWSIHRRFPVVALVGVVRPELFVATQVVSECSAGELKAMAAHEIAHVAARDNLWRWLFRATPGARLARTIGEPLERAWRIASEEAADMRARRTASPVDLASALTKVTRLASHFDALPQGSMLIGGAQLASRVHRLLDAPTESDNSHFAWLPAALAFTVGLALQAEPVLRRLHELFELLVRR